MRYLFGLLFDRTVIEIGYKNIGVLNFRSSDVQNSDFRHLVKYLESVQPDYFKLIFSIEQITNHPPLRVKAIISCVNLATDIKCHDDPGIMSFINNQGCLSKVSKLLLTNDKTTSSLFQNLTNTSMSLYLDVSHNSYSSQSFIKVLDNLKQMPVKNRLHKITFNVYRIGEEQIYRDLAEFFKDSNASIYLSIGSSRGTFQSPFPLSYIRSLGFSSQTFEEGSPLESIWKNAHPC
ncbi:unnamed protein product [Ambrosiozyma monospora]|uniref:Unnamed protein product n=1 Tax=Ambrosiozyma monospora TaxID=43982 RepID=A0ACB5TAB9_AMBMO|nr:unnamed protein product [Ambrosiozyma monospora]